MTIATPNWEIRENVFGFNGPGNSFLVPKASQLFSAVFAEKPLPAPFDGCASVRESVRGVRFSRLGASVELEFVSENGTHSVQCRAKANRGGKFYDVTSLVSRKIDHAVFDGVWFYRFPCRKIPRGKRHQRYVARVIRLIFKCVKVGV